MEAQQNGTRMMMCCYGDVLFTKTGIKTKTEPPNMKKEKGMVVVGSS